MWIGLDWIGLDCVGCGYSGECLLLFVIVFSISVSTDYGVVSTE